jgi:hypothetical protein
MNTAWKFNWDRDLKFLIHDLSNLYGRIVKVEELPFNGDTTFYEGEIIKLKDRWSLNTQAIEKEEEDSQSSEGKTKEATASFVYQQWEDDPEIRSLANHGVDDCEEEFLPEGSVNSSDGYRERKEMPRNIVISASDNLREIWTQVETKLGIPRSHYALVSGSRYLPESGTWLCRLQWVEIRFRGLGVGPHQTCS